MSFEPTYYKSLEDEKFWECVYAELASSKYDEGALMRAAAVGAWDSGLLTIKQPRRGS